MKPLLWHPHVCMWGKTFVPILCPRPWAHPCGHVRTYWYES